MEEFDFELDFFDQNENNAIIIENVEDVINFDDGFYREDKAVHILNLLSNNNLTFDVGKYKKYWERKIDNIMAIGYEKQQQQFNKNVFAMVEMKKKVSNDSDHPCMFNDDDTILADVEQYLLARKKIVVPYNYGTYSEEKQYVNLAPYETSQSGENIDKDVDVFSLSLERQRFLTETDKLVIIGYVNSPLSYGFTYDLDVVEYIESLENIVVGSKITINDIDGKIYTGKCTSNDTQAKILRAVVGDKNIKYDYRNFTKNTFLLWAETKNETFGRNNYINGRIVLKNITGYEHEAYELISYSTNDLFTIMTTEKPRTLDDIVKEYPSILDSIKRNRRVTEFFAYYKDVLKTANPIIDKKNKTKNKPKEKGKDIVETSLAIIKWLKSEKSTQSTQKKEKEKEKDDDDEFTDTKFFFNVEEMYTDEISESTQQKAILVTSSFHYKQKEKDGDKEFSRIVYNNASAFNLVRKKLETGKLVWDLSNELFVPKKSLPIPSNVGETKQEPFVTRKDAIDFLTNYSKKKCAKQYDIKRPLFVYSTNRSYENFQGDDDTNDDDFIAEFGVQMDSLVEEGKKDDNEEEEQSFGEQVVHNLANVFSIRLSKQQIVYISKFRKIKKEETTKQHRRELMVTFLIYVSLFILFLQMSLPSEISNFSQSNIYSYPINKEDTGSKKFALIDDFVNVISKGINDSVFSDVLNNQVQLKSNPQSMILKMINSILKDKPIFEIRLASTRNQYTNIGTVKGISYPLWDTFRPRKEKKFRTQKIKIPRIENALLIKKANQIISAPINHISRINNNIIKTPKKDVTHKNAQYKLTGVFETNLFLREIVETSEKESAYNALSEEIDEISKTDSKYKKFVTNAMSSDNRFLINFINYNIKDLFGKITYEYKDNENKGDPNHIDFLKLFYSIKNQDSTREKISNITKDYLSDVDYDIDDKDVKYVIIYLILLIITDVGDPISSYILDSFEESLNINKMSTEQAMAAYLQSREERKQKYMQTYKNMDSEIRKLTKELIEVGIMSRDGLITSNENITNQMTEELAQEDLQLRKNSENDNYDINEEE